MAISDVRLRQFSPLPRREPLGFIVLSVLLTLSVTGFIAWQVYGDRNTLLNTYLQLAIWTASIVLLNVLDLKASNGRVLSPDVPLYIAVGLTLPVATAGLVVFIGSVDKRELEGRLSLTRSLFNRSQSALSVMLSAAVVRLLPPELQERDRLILGAVLALLTMTAANYFLVFIAAWLADGIPVRHSVGHLTLGRPIDFLLTWLGWGFMGLLLAGALHTLGSVAVILFTVPALVGRQVLARSNSLVKTTSDLEGKQRAITELSSRISDERRDERRLIASRLHDDVLQPLFQVSLMCEVVSQDSKTGRLLELDRDVPLLGLTADSASRNLRGVIARLRNSPPGLRGLNSTLRALAKDLETRASGVEISLELEEIRGVEDRTQLLVYQVAKEAITNAVRHARASKIRVFMTREVDAIRLSVEDNGIGFDPNLASQDHFGVLIMRERTEAVGGIFHIDSVLGDGTIVAARVPCPSPRYPLFD